MLLRIGVDIAVARLAEGWRASRDCVQYPGIAASFSSSQEPVRMDYVEHAGIRIAKPLYDFVNSEALPGTSIGT